MAVTGHMHCKECGFHIADGTRVCPLCGGAVVPEDKRNSVGIGFDNDLFARCSDAYFKDENDMFYGDAGLLKNESAGQTADYIKQVKNAAAYTPPLQSAHDISSKYSRQAGARNAKKGGKFLWIIIVLVMAISFVGEIISENEYKIEEFFNNIFNTQSQSENVEVLIPTEETKYYGEQVEQFITADTNADGWGIAQMDETGFENIDKMYIPQSESMLSISDALNKSPFEYEWQLDGVDASSDYMLTIDFEDYTRVQMYFEHSDNEQPVVRAIVSYMKYDYDPDSFAVLNYEDSEKILKAIYSYS